MLVDTMVPEAFEAAGPTTGPITGLVTVLGFAVAFGLQSMAG